MPQPLEVSETIARKIVETDVSRNIAIPSKLPPAARVVSVNARVEITQAEAQRGRVEFSGIIRTTIFYAAQDNPDNVVTIRRNLEFSDTVSVPNARRGYDVNIEAAIGDIDFNLINNRLIGLEYEVVSSIEVTTAERVPLAEERPEVQFRTRDITIRRELRERNYTRELSNVIRLDDEASDIRRIIEVENSIQIVDIIAGNNRVRVRGNINNDIIYVSTQNQIESTTVDFSFSESFSFRGVRPEMSPFVETIITDEEVERLDNRRVRKTVTVQFKILVVSQREVQIPTDIVTPEVTPVTRTIIVDRVVTEERTRILTRGQINVPQDNPAVARIIKATGRLRGGSLAADAQDGGVLLTGTIDVNLIYVADLPQQPVYFARGTIRLNYFVDIPEVESDMNAVADAEVIRTTASEVDPRSVSVRSVLDVNLVVTDQVRVNVVTGIRDGEAAPVEEGFITYTVKSGDSLYLIGQRYGVSVQRLIEINDIRNPNQISIGQQILIPQ